MNVLAYVHLRNIHRSTGAGRVARNLTESLAAQPDVAVRILADRRDHDRLPPEIGAPWAGFRYAFISGDTSSQQARWLLLRRPRAETFWPEADITFCTAESYVPKGRTRLVVTAHDAAYFEDGIHEPGMATWKQRLKWRLLYAVLSSQADMIHTVSRFSAERLAHAFPALAPRIRVVHNAVTPVFFTPPAALDSGFLGQHQLHDCRYVHVPGGLSYRKNADLILAVWPRILAAMPHAVLAISGNVGPSYRAAARRLGASVRLVGFTTDEELKVLYHHAALTWFPSRYEGFGLPVLESMACGAPVISSDAAAIPEVAGGHALLLPVADVETHREHVVDLLRDDARRAEMSSAGQAHARRFTWERAGQELAQHFRDVIM